MKIRAKFQCGSVEVSEYTEMVKFHAVSSEDGQGNKEWSDATPFGLLEMRISNSGARGFYKPGKSYFLDITEAD
jgi:hypothetical protein